MVLPGPDSWCFRFSSVIMLSRQNFWGVLCTGLLIVCASARASAEPDTVLVLGDSLSAAYGLPTDQGWVHALEQKFHATAPAVKLVNASASGATTAAGLSQLPHLLAEHQPDYVLLQLGANDGLQGKPVDYIRANLAALIEGIQDNGADVILIGIRLPPNFGRRYTEPFYAMFESLAQDYQTARVPFLLDGVAGNDALMQRDGLHPKAEAQASVLENVWPVVEAQLQLNGTRRSSSCVSEASSPPQSRASVPAERHSGHR